MDFTIEKYRQLLAALKSHKNFSIKHDVDNRPLFSLRIAEIESSMDIQTSYYFRSKDFTTHAETIRAIARMGHTIGYHYENLATCNGDIKTAFDDFCLQLEQLRKITPVSTACAHGSPLSRYDNQELWNHYDIHTLGIDFEPMLDTDFRHTLYLTDTGRRWDGQSVSVRDKAPQSPILSLTATFSHTDDIIHAINDLNHPIHRYSLLVNTHPQRWMPFGPQWLKELLLQRTKNIIKRIIVKKSQP